MKIFADWVVKDESFYLAASVLSVLPIIDCGVIVDTGSSDGTLEIAEALVKLSKDKLKLVQSPTLLTQHEVGIKIDDARNLGLSYAPDDTDWYWVFAGDEIYDYKAVGVIRSFLEGITADKDILFVNVSYIDYTRLAVGSAISRAGATDRPVVYRYVKGMRWGGIFDREAVYYPDDKNYINYLQKDFRDKYFMIEKHWRTFPLSYDHFHGLKPSSKEREEYYKLLTKRGL